MRRAHPAPKIRSAMTKDDIQAIGCMSVMLPNAKLTDDEERAQNPRNGTVE